MSANLINPVEHLKLAYCVAKKFVRNELVKDSIEYSLACEALIKSANGYNPENGTFANFAVGNMKNEIKNYLRANKAKKRTTNYKEMTDSEWLQLSEENNEKDEFLLWLEQSSENWNEQEKKDLQIFLSHHVDKVQIQEIASQLGVSRQTIHNRLKQITNKIKRAA